MLSLSDLIVTHNDLRNRSVLSEMICFVKNNHLYNKANLSNFAQIRSLLKPSPVIQITRFEDGRLFIHDGHHRVVSCFLGGRLFLHEEEYQISFWTYAQYMDVSHEQGWYTPFDPRTHVRSADFSSFKREIKKRFDQGDPFEKIIDWINENKSLFCSKRNIWTVEDLAKIVADHQGSLQKEEATKVLASVAP